MLKEWERTLNEFLKNWKEKENVIGAMVCGSYVTGDSSPHSDIDVHIILSDEVDWRERGNMVINNYLIEYFANPPKQIKRYFEDDYNDLRSHSMVQFLTGKIIFDKYNEIEVLKNEARVWFDKKYKELNNNIVELMKYHLWDTLDNLEDCYEQDRIDFDFVYFNSLKVLYEEYSKYLRIETMAFYQISGYFSQPNFLDKYMAHSFPDKYFSDKFLSSLYEGERSERMMIYTELTHYLLDKMGGFNIDGWGFKSMVD